MTTATEDPVEGEEGGIENAFALLQELNPHLLEDPSEEEYVEMRGQLIANLAAQRRLEKTAHGLITLFDARISAQGGPKLSDKEIEALVPPAALFIAAYAKAGTGKHDQIEDMCRTWRFNPRPPDDTLLEQVMDQTRKDYRAGEDDFVASLTPT